MSASLTVIALMLAGPGLQAQTKARPPTVVRFGDVLKKALRKNPDLRNAGFDLELAHKSIKEAQGIYDTALNAGVNYSGRTSRPIPGNFFTTARSDSLNWSVGATQKLPTGGSVSLTWETTWTRTKQLISFDPTAPPEERRVTSVDSSLLLSVTHPLLKGVGIDVTNAAIRQAKLTRDASRWALLGKARAVVRDLLQAYLDVGESQAQARMRVSGLTQARRDLRRVKALLEAGRMAPTEMVDYQLAVARRERELLEARTLWLTRSLELRRLAGEKMFRRPRPLQVSLDGLPLRARVPTMAEARERALRSSAELTAAMRELKVLHISEKVARRNRLPTLDLTGSVGPTGQSNDVGKAYSNLFRFRSLSWSVGLTFSYLIGNRVSVAQAEKATLEIAKKRVSIEDLRRSLVNQAVQAVALLKQQAKLIQVARLERKLAAIRLDNERKKYAAGRSTSFILFEQENAVIAARAKLVSARVGFLKRQAELSALTGELLSRVGVRQTSRGLLVGSR